MWQKKESKLELAVSMIRQVVPEFHSKDHIIILCDSWYTKQNLVSIVDEYPNLDLIGNARIDSVMYDLAPAQTGRRGRPAKHGKHLSVETDFTFSNEKIGDYYALSGGVTMDKNMNKDDFMNDLYDYLWVPEDEQGALYLHQNILFGRAADEEKIACATLPYLFRLGITPQMRGYEILCRAVILYLLDGIQNSTHLTLLMTIAVERGTSLTSVERACAAAVRYAWNEGYMSADDECPDAFAFREMPTVTQFIDRLAEAVRRKLGDEIKL